MILHGSEAGLCGPGGDPPPIFPSLDRERVERICRAALAEPDRNAALRFLNAALPEADSPVPGMRNEGLFATHQLHKGVPHTGNWAGAAKQAAALVDLRGEELVQGLGYSVEHTAGPFSILRADGQRRALAVFLQRDEAPDLPNSRFTHLSPVSYALAKADQENLEWVIVTAGAAVRLHPVGIDVGTGRRGRTETFFELRLDLLQPSDAAYLWLTLSAEALEKGGSVAGLLLDSAQ